MKNNTLQTSPDWSTAPEWAQYWAINANGKAYFWARKPEVYNDGFCTFVFGSLVKYSGLFDAANWQTSLQERPKL